MAIQVSSYSFGWNPRKNVGVVLMKMDDGRKARIVLESAAEFTALATVLREGPVFANSEGFLYTSGDVLDEER